MEGICSICKGQKKVHKNNQTNELICETCYHRDIHLEECGFCGKVKSVTKRTDDGKAVCPNCYQQIFRLDICPRCKQEKPLLRIILGKMVCQSCCKKRLRWVNMGKAERIITELDLRYYRVKTRDPISGKLIRELDFIPPLYRGGFYGKSYDELGEEIAALRFGDKYVFGEGYDSNFDAFSQIEWLFSVLKRERKLESFY